jgi:hypothetical protein
MNFDGSCGSCWSECSAAGPHPAGSRRWRCRPSAPAAPRRRRPCCCRSRDVLHHDRRIAGNVLSEMPADQPRIAVKAAADRRADGDPHGLAAIEVGDRILRGGAACEAECNGKGDQASCHDRSLVAAPVPAMLPDDGRKTKGSLGARSVRRQGDQAATRRIVARAAKTMRPGIGRGVPQSRRFGLGRARPSTWWRTGCRGSGS